jgi:hypothetical protein
LDPAVSNGLDKPFTSLDAQLRSLADEILDEQVPELWLDILGGQPRADDTCPEAGDEERSAPESEDCS